MQSTGGKKNCYSGNGRKGSKRRREGSRRRKVENIAENSLLELEEQGRTRMEIAERRIALDEREKDAQSQ